MNYEEIEHARNLFPNGLEQPSEGYRFSVDPLLLADFFRPVRKGRGVDLGTGCGIIPLAVQLNNPYAEMEILGVDVRPVAIECAEKNRALLGMAGSLFFDLVDITDTSKLPAHQSCDFALANPPFRTGAEGRGCPDADRQKGRFEEEGSLKDFVRAAAHVLKSRGRFSMVHLPERIVDIFTELRAAKLEPKRIQMVHSRVDEPAKILLVEATKGAKAGLVVEPPLVLYKGKGKDTSSLNRWCR